MSPHPEDRFNNDRHVVYARLSVTQICSECNYVLHVSHSMLQAFLESYFWPSSVQIAQIQQTSHPSDRKATLCTV